MKYPIAHIFLVSVLLSHFSHSAEFDEKTSRYHQMLSKKPDSPAVLSRMIDAWLENSDIKELQLLLESKTINGTPTDWRILSSFLEYSGDDQAALKALDAALKTTPQDPATRLARAKLSGKLLLFDNALPDLDIAVTDPALKLEATTLRGRYLARAGKPDAAVETWTKLIADNPLDTGLQEDLLDLLIEENLMDQAIEVSKKITDGIKDPYQKTVRRLRTAEILGLSTKKTEAAAEYIAILDLAATDSWLERETIAQAQKLFQSQDDTLGWKKFLDDAIVASPTRTVLQEQLAAHYQSTNNSAAAIEIYKKLIQTNPGIRPLRESLATLLEQSNKFPEAIAELKSLIAQYPTEQALWEKMATLHQLLKQNTEVDAALAESEKLIPQDEAGRIQAAQLYLRFAKIDMAEKILRQAFQTHGPQSESADSLANFLATHDKQDEAVTLWVTAAKNADREALLRISRSLSAHAKYTQATTVLQDRIAEFAADPLILSALVQSASLAEKVADYVPHAITLVRLSATPTDVENNIKLSTVLISRAELTEKCIADISQNPKPSLGELCLLAELQESIGDSLNAEKSLEKAATMEPALTASLQKIRLLEKRGELAAAAQAMRDILAQPGGNKPNFHKQLVELLQRSGDTPAALAAIQAWKTLAPGDKSVWLKNAELLAESGASDKATSELRRACAKFGNEVETREKLVQSRIDAGATNEALRILLQLHDEAESNTAKLKYAPQIAQSAAAEGREDEIESLFRKRARENPTATAPLMVLRSIMETWQRQDKADELLLEAARRKPDDVELQSQVAEIYEVKGDIAKAESILLALLNKTPTPDLQRRLATFYQRIGDDLKGEAIIVRLALESKDPRQLETLAGQYISQQSYTLVINLLGPAISRHPGDWRLAYLYAVALEYDKQYDKAFAAFLPLTHIMQEVPGYTAPLPLATQGRQYSSGYGFDSSKISKEELPLALYNYAQNIHQAIVQSQNPNYGRSNQSITSLIPTKPEQIRVIALKHCIQLTERESPEQQSKLRSQLTSQDIPFFAVLLKLKQMSSEKELTAYVRENSADINVVQAAMVLNRPNNSYSGNESKVLFNKDLWGKVYDSIKDSHPVIAFNALLMSSKIQIIYGGRKEVAPSLTEVTEIYEAFSRLPQASMKNRYYLLERLSAAITNQKDIPDELKEKIKLLAEKSNPNGETNAAKDMIELRKLCEEFATSLKADDYTKAAALCNQLLPMQKKIMVSMKNQYGNPYAYSQTSQSNFTQLLYNDNVTPISIDQLTESLSLNSTMQFFAQQTGTAFLAKFYQQREVVSEKQKAARQEILKSLNIKNEEKKKPDDFTLEIKDPAAFAKAVQLVQDPLIRIAILYGTNQQEAVKQLLPELTKDANSPSAELLLWASCYTSSNLQDFKNSYALAVRARQILPRNYHSLADVHIAALGIKLADNKDIDLDPARSALLRCSKSLASMQQNTTYTAFIAKHLRKLGQEDAAKRLLTPRVIAKNTNYRGMSNSPFSNRYSQPSRSQSTNLATLVSKGDKAAAARLVWQQLRALGQTGNASYYGQQLKEQITPLKLTDELVALQPPATASLNKRIEFAKLISSVIEPTSILAYLEGLHKEDPKDSTVLSLLCLASSPEKRVDLIKKFSPVAEDDFTLLGQSLQPALGLRSSDNKKEQITSNLAAWDAVLELLNSISPEQSYYKNLSWVNYSLLQFITYSNYSNDVIFPYGTAPSPLDATSTEAEVKANNSKIELSTQRDKTIRNIAEKMLIFPETSRQAFILLHSGRKSLKITDQQLQQYALQSVKTQLIPSPEITNVTKLKYNNSAAYLFRLQSDNQLWANYSGNGSSSSSEDAGNFDALTYLLTASSEQKNAEWPTTILSYLSAADRSVVQSWLSYFENPQPDEAKKLISTLNANSDNFSTDSERLLLLAFSLAESRDIVSIAALKQLLEEALQNKGFDENGNGVPNHLISLCSSITKIAKTRAQPMSVLTMVLETILGPQKNWQNYARAFSENSYDDSDPLMVRYSIAQRLLIGSNRGENDYSLARLRNSTQLFSSNSFSALRLSGTDVAADLIKLIDSGLLLSGTGMFTSSNATQMFAESSIGFTRNYSDGREELALGKQLLTVEGTSRFWARILGAKWAKQDHKIVLAEVEKELPNIKKWPKWEQEAFSNYLANQWPALEKTPLSAWIKSNRISPEDEFTKCETELSEVLLNLNGDEQIRQILNSMINIDPKKTAAIFLKMHTQSQNTTGRFSNSVNTNGVQMSYQRYYLEQAVERLSSNGVDIKKYVLFALALQDGAYRPASNRLEENVRQAITYRLNNNSQQMKSIPELKGLESSQALTLAFFADLCAGADEKYIGKLLVIMLENISLMKVSDTNEVKILKPWLATKLKQKNKNVVTFFALATLPRASTDFTKDFLALLSSSSFTPQDRVSVLNKATINSTIHRTTLEYNAKVVEIIEKAPIETSPELGNLVSLTSLLANNTTLTPELAIRCCKLMPSMANKCMELDPNGENYSSSIELTWNRFINTARSEILIIEATKSHPELFLGKSDIILMAMEYEWNDTAIALLPKPAQLANLPMSFFGAPYPEWQYFSKTSELALPTFLEKIADPQQRYRMEVILSSYPNVPDKKNLPTLTRKERMKKLALRFAAEAPPQLLIRAEIVAMLADTSSPDIQKELPKLIAGTDFPALQNAVNQSRNGNQTYNAEAYIKLNLYKLAIKTSLLQGDPTLWAKAMNDILLSYNPQSIYECAQQIVQFIETTGFSYLDAMLANQGDKQQKLHKEFFKILTNPMIQDSSKYDSDHAHRLQLLSIISCSIANKASDHDIWIKSLTDDMSKRLNNNASNSDPRWVYYFQRATLTKPDGTSAKADICKNLMSDVVLSKVFIPHMTAISAMIDGKLLKSEEAFNIIDELPNDFPRKAEYLTEKAGYIGYRSKKIDEALSIYEQAEKIAVEQKQAAVIALTRAYHASFLKGSDRIKEAETLAATIDLSLLIARDKEFLGDLAKLGIKAEVKPKE